MNMFQKSLTIAGTVFFATHVHALTIKLGETNLGNSSTGGEVSWAQGLITTYNQNNDPDLPTPLSLLTGGLQTSGDNSKSFSLDLGSYDFAYVFLKWGGGQNNPYSHQFFYSDADVDFTSPEYTKQNGNKGQGGQSHYYIWYGTRPPDDEIPKVPDGGVTVMMLGVGLSGMGFMRRIWAKA